MSGTASRIEPDDQKLHDALGGTSPPCHLPGDDLNAGVVDDFLEMVHDVLGAWARGEPGEREDTAARVLAAQIPAYTALGRLYRITHEAAAGGEGGSPWLRQLEAATHALREATDRMAEAARLRAVVDLASTAAAG